MARGGKGFLSEDGESRAEFSVRVYWEEGRGQWTGEQTGGNGGSVLKNHTLHTMSYEGDRIMGKE